MRLELSLGSEGLGSSKTIILMNKIRRGQKINHQFYRIYIYLLDLLFMSMFFRQFAAIQAKNWSINRKGHQVIRENIATLILAVFIIVSVKSSSSNQFTTLYLAIAITGFSRTVAVWWLQEKESYQKELQKIMGVSYLSYLLSWLFYILINGLIVAALMMILMRIFVITDDSEFFQGDYTFWNLAILYVLFVVSSIGYTMFLCCFFSSAKVGSQAITFIQLISNFLYFLRFASDLAQSPTLVGILSIFPQMVFNMTTSSISSANDGYLFDFNYSRGIITLVVSIPVYTLLAVYLDQIMPNQLGTHKHPLFFLGFLRQPVGERSHEFLLQDNSHEQVLDQQTSAKYEEQVERKTKPLIQMRGISKSFKEKLVIDNLTMSFYGGEIFCLLGHNGAGKSTTINLLTGLLEANSGDINILGFKYPNDIDQIRKDIGLCLQFNVLYDNLTVEEHLRYYYRIKNLDDSRMEQQVNRTIQDCFLVAQRKKLSKNLSGGNKRKLCLANSLIGGARIIILDEPSSGLDPNARQSIWTILKTISTQNRCIILTTHHLQQAEELSKRIAIMSKGKLIILGSTEFITHHFTVGYHVVITLNRDLPHADKICREIITAQLSKCTEDKQTAKNTLKFILPLAQLPNFSKAFKALQDAKVGLISVFISNLEDAFVKIGQEEENINEGFEQLKLNSQSQLEPKEGEEPGQRKEQELLVLPPVSCSFSFWSQFKAVFFKKAKTVLRSLSSFISIILPSAFMTIGVIIVCVAIPNNQTDQKNFANLNRIRLYILSYFMIWGFIFNTSSYCGSIVLEREKRFKYLSNVSGMRQLPYWTANYFFDLLIFYLPLAIFFIVVVALGDDGRFVTQFAGYLIALLVLFGFSFIGYSYLFSFVFQKSNTAYRFFPFINLVFFYFLPLIPYYVDPAGFLNQYVMPILTPFVALSSFFNTAEVLGDTFGQTGLNQLYIPYLALGVQTVVYTIAVFLLQNMRFSLKATQSEQDLLHGQPPINQPPINQPPINQPPINQTLSNQGNNNSAPRRSSFANAPIKIDHLTKIYGNGKVAIRDNSFAVGEGQIFGLLGPNGAGKSTSFNIITAAQPKTSGSVQLFGEEVNRGIMNVFQQVGVCPQYNPIYENLTVQQHLQYFALLKGITSDLVASTIKFYGQVLSLQPYMKVKAGVLSGGNKRKLCVAMAMIGNPNVIFFDQPSAGVDPISRRYLWKCLTVATNSKKTSMILTTHSMNEAETLCSRIGILIKGQFICLDTPAGLKQQYGKGYRVNVLAEPEFQPEIERIVNEQFQQVEVLRVDTEAKRLVFVIKTDKFCLSRAFHLFENKLKTQGKIVRYEIKQSTLEEVFIHLSRLQPVVEEEQYSEPWQILCWEWGSNGCQLTV